MLKIRPHHLICMQAYMGKGYSREFEENMSFVVESLEKNKKQIIKVIERNDDICSKCPNSISGIKCISNDKVLSIDNKVLKELDLEPGEYTYISLLDRVKEKMNKNVFKNICSECDWYELEICSNIFKEKGFI